MGPSNKIAALKTALQDLARETGRGDDTLLAHITREEADHLEAKYGGGTTNPDTGLKEYGEPGAGRGGEGSTGGGGAAGGGGAGGGGSSDSDRGGRASRGDVRGGAQGRGAGRGGTGRGGRGSGAGQGADAPGNLGRAAGPAGPAPGKGREGGTGGTSHGDAPSNTRGGVGGQPGVGASHGPQGSSASPGNAISRALSAALSLGFGVPPNPMDLADEEKDLVGVPAAVRDFAEAFGPAVNKGLSALGLDPGHSPESVDSPDPQGPTGVGVSPPGGVPAGGGDFALPEPQPPDLGLSRPEALTPPDFLGLGNAMTPLQQRAKIATFGTGSEQGGFRSQPAQDYFKNLILRSVVGDDGQIAAGAQILPVEAQYAQENLGLDLQPEMGVEDFARAISNLPPAEQAQAILAAFQAAQPQPRVQEGSV